MYSSFAFQVCELLLWIRVSQPQHYWCLGSDTSGGCPVHCWMFSNILGLNPLNDSSNLSSCDNQKHLQTLPISPEKKKSLPAENYWPTGKITIILWIPRVTQSLVEVCMGPPEPEGWMALLIYTKHSGSCLVVGSYDYGSQTIKKSSLFWSWHIETNPAKWFKHYFVVWVQFRGNMQGSTRHLSYVRT